MRSFAKARGLRLAPRKNASIALLATLASATLVIGHDAGAVPGAPALPNLNFPHLIVPAPDRSTSPMNASGRLLTANVAGIMNQPDTLIKYQSAPVATTQADGQPLWNGQGALPNAFKSPWHFSTTSFDPTFRTPYYNEADGFKNNSSSPWNQGVAGQIPGYGSSVFSRGLAYLGKADYSSLMPVWGGDDADTTSALFAHPQAGVAL